MTHYPERPINPPDPPISVEAEIEAIVQDENYLISVLQNDRHALWTLAYLYRKGNRDALLYHDAIDDAVHTEAERRVEEHLK